MQTERWLIACTVRLKRLHWPTCVAHCKIGTAIEVPMKTRFCNSNHEDRCSMASVQHSHREFSESLPTACVPGLFAFA